MGKELAGGVAGAIASWYRAAQWLRVLAIAGLALRLVGPGTAGEAAVRGVVAGHVAGAIASGRGALQFLRVRLQMVAVRTRTARQSAKGFPGLVLFAKWSWPDKSPGLNTSIGLETFGFKVSFNHGPKP